MNFNKLFKIMPFVLGGLIVILIAVLILRDGGEPVKTADDKNIEQQDTQADTSAQGKVADESSKLPVQEQQSVENTQPDTATESTPSQPVEQSADEGEAQTENSTVAVDGDTSLISLPEEEDMSFGLTFEEKSDYVDIKANVNIRKGASTAADIVTTLAKEERHQRTGYNKEWTRIIYNDEVCYVSTPLVLREAATLEDPVEEKQEDQAGEVTALTTTQREANGKLICIDPGHQLKGNSSKEPLGPGSSEMKAKVSSGTAGNTTGYEEYKLNLVVSKKLEAELNARGYTVIMTREVNEVDISNSERSAVANDALADAFIRIHANSSADTSVNGVETICMTSDNKFNGNLYTESRKLSDCVLDNVVSRTGAKKRYVWETDTMTGINWAEVPVTILEMGYMSNEKEEKLLLDEDYQNKIVLGIADGIDAYFK